MSATPPQPDLDFAMRGIGDSLDLAQEAFDGGNGNATVASYHLFSALGGVGALNDAGLTDRRTNTAARRWVLGCMSAMSYASTRLAAEQAAA